jgi:Flp pilus assembly protein TadG
MRFSLRQSHRCIRAGQSKRSIQSSIELWHWVVRAIFHSFSDRHYHSHAAGCPMIRKGVLGHLKEDRGSGLVEYAIVFTIFMTMLLGIADFGRALYAYHYTSSAARDATRYAIVRGATCINDGSCTAQATQTDISNFVKNAPLGIDPANLQVTATWLNGNHNPGSVVTVQVQYSFSFAVPIVSKLVNGGNPLVMQSTSSMVISH